MAVLNREQFMERLRARIGEDTSDDAVSLLEDFTDTWDDWETRFSAANEGDWKAKYEENDRAWRDKYTKRFFSGKPPEEAATKDEALENQTNDVKEDGDVKTFDELFSDPEGGD